MAELTVSQLIKIIIGVFVVVVVVLGIYIFFKDYIIDFFKNLSGEESEEEKIKGMPSEEESENEESLESKTSSRLCEDCGKGVFKRCKEEECFEISKELIPFGKQCKFEKKFILSKCTTFNF
jgi:hypothetical protein